MKRLSISLVAIAALAGTIAAPAPAQQKPTIYAPAPGPAGPPCTVGLSNSAAFLAEWEPPARQPAVGGLLNFDCRACTTLTRITLSTTPIGGEPPYDVDRLYAADAAGRQKFVDKIIGSYREVLCPAEAARVIDARTIDGKKFAGIYTVICGVPRQHRMSYFSGTPGCAQSVEVSWWSEKTLDNANEAIIERAFGHVVFSR